MATYIQSGTGAVLSDAQINSGSFPPGTYFMALGGGGQQLTQSQISAAAQPTPAPGQNLPSTVLQQVTSNMGPGMQNDPNQVRALQQALVQAGYLTQTQMNTGPGIYGPQTTAAVAAWQKAVGVPVTNSTQYGYFGPISMKFIGVNSQAISPTQPKDQYAGTPAGQTSVVDTSHALPDNVINPGAGSANLYNIPPEVFPGGGQLKPGTPEYQAALDKIDSSYYDILQQQMTASTEQEKGLADYNFGQLKNYIQTNLGISLSNDAIQGWQQLQGMKNQYGALNIEGSGIQNEAMDKYLQSVRLNDKSQRFQAQTREQEAQQAYYTQYATPDQVKSFVASNPDLAKQWGLLPSDNKTMAQRTADLKAKYPNMTSDQIAQSLATMYDDNGNYRSALYQRYMTGNNAGVDSGNITNTTYDYQALDANGNPLPAAYHVTPSDTGMLDINAAKTYNQTANADAQSAISRYNTLASKGLITVSGQANPSANPQTTQQFDVPKTSGSTSSSPAPVSTTQPTLSNPMPSSKTAPTGNTTSSTTSSPYTFQKDSYGNIVTFQNGTRIGTGTAGAASSQYGYTGNL